MGRYRREFSVAAVLVLLWLLPALKGATTFYTLKNLRDLLVANAPLLVASVGMTLLILARHIDISIGAQMALCAVVAGLLAKTGLPMPLVALLTLAAGAALGAMNGLLVAGLQLPSIVVTLATLVIWRDGLRWWRSGEFVLGLPMQFQWFGLRQDVGQWFIITVSIGVLLVFAWMLNSVAAGRAVYAVGSDPEAARLAGLRTRWVVFSVFVLLGMLSGLAALLNAIRFPNVDPNLGTGSELQVIAAVVVGGAAISGGRGRLLGTALGVLLLGTMGPTLVHLGIQAQWEKAIQGLIILLAVASDALGRRGRK